MKKIINDLHNKYNNLSKKQQRCILGSIIAFFFIITIVSLRPSFSSTETGYLSNQTVNGLSFENAAINVVGGVTTYTVEVVNDSENIYNLKNINVIFKDVSNKEIVTLYGYIGEKLNVDEKKMLKASIDKEITEIGSINYEIKK